MNADQTEDLVRRVLKRVPKFYSEDAVKLLMLTWAIESDGGKYIRQLGGGPALGYWQVEPATMRDIYDNFLVFRRNLSNDILLATGVGQPNEWHLEVNIAYNIIMARLVYWRSPDPIPTTDEGRAKYHNEIYNGGRDNYSRPDWQVALAKYRLYCL